MRGLGHPTLSMTLDTHASALPGRMGGTGEGHGRQSGAPGVRWALVGAAS